MGFPQITESQVSLLQNMANGIGAFSEMVPDMFKDKAKEYEERMESVRDTEQLVILGLIKEITNDESNKEKLVQIFSMTGRLFRIFEITEIGKKLFEGEDKRTVQ